MLWLVSTVTTVSGKPRPEYKDSFANSYGFIRHTSWVKLTIVADIGEPTLSGGNRVAVGLCSCSRSEKLYLVALGISHCI